MMLRRMGVEWITSNWPLLKMAVIRSGLVIARKDEGELNRVLESLLVGKLACWVAGDPQVHTVILASVVMEEISGTKNVMVYCAHGFRLVKSEEYLEIGKEFGMIYKNQGCSNVILYSANDKLTKLMNKFNANTENTLIFFPLVKNLPEVEDTTNG